MPRSAAARLNVKTSLGGRSRRVHPARRAPLEDHRSRSRDGGVTCSSGGAVRPRPAELFAVARALRERDERNSSGARSTAPVAASPPGPIAGSPSPKVTSATGNSCVPSAPTSRATWASGKRVRSRGARTARPTRASAPASSPRPSRRGGTRARRSARPCATGPRSRASVVAPSAPAGRPQAARARPGRTSGRRRQVRRRCGRRRRAEEGSVRRPSRRRGTAASGGPSRSVTRIMPALRCSSRATRRGSASRRAGPRRARRSPPSSSPAILRQRDVGRPPHTLVRPRPASRSRWPRSPAGRADPRSGTVWNSPPRGYEVSRW